jgi:4'-phosphopantetheinyl transferase EntD
VTDPDYQRITVRDLLQGLLPDAVSVAVWGLDTTDVELESEEREAIRRAVPKRVDEFARGRATARFALAQMGWAPVAIPVGGHRQPVWPDGVVGTITHTGDVVAAAVARASDVSCLGIDVESGVALPPGTDGLILTSAEQTDPAPVHGLVRFSAKESIHKAVFPCTGVWLDPLDVEIGLEGTRFEAQPVHQRADAQEADALLGDLEGRWTAVAGCVVSVAWAGATGA